MRDYFLNARDGQLKITATAYSIETREKTRGRQGWILMMVLPVLMS